MNRSELGSFLLIEYAHKGGVIGVCGLPGAGKSTLVKKLSDVFFGRALAINIDDFCVVETPARKSFLQEALNAEDRNRLRYLASPETFEDNPYANPVSWYDWNAAASVIQKLKHGQSALRHDAWNQKTGLCDRTVAYEPPNVENPLLIVDCVYLFEAPLSQEIDTFVLIEESPEVSHQREKLRDAHRNDPIYAEYKKYVTDLYCVPYLSKYKNNMDFVVS